MKCNHRRRAALLTLLLLAGLIAVCGLWLRAQQRQYALNRALIAALVKGDDRRALALVNAGADPNTRYDHLPAPTIRQLWNQLLDRSPGTVNHSPTALLIACGAFWNNKEAIAEQLRRPHALPLIQVMLTHKANVNATSGSMTPLKWAVALGLTFRLMGSVS